MKDRSLVFTVEEELFKEDTEITKRELARLNDKGCFIIEYFGKKIKAIKVFVKSFPIPNSKNLAFSIREDGSHKYCYYRDLHKTEKEALISYYKRCYHEAYKRCEDMFKVGYKLERECDRLSKKVSELGGKL